MEALILFFSGVVAHAFGIRIFNVWNKTTLYKVTFINCLALLKLSENASKELLKMLSPAEKESIEIIFKHWQRMALYSLRNAVPDNTWRQISIEDWDQAMKILSIVEKEQK
jgi:protein gp37